MKTITLLLALLASVAFQAQEVLHFKVKYKENTAYSQKMTTATDMSMAFYGSHEVMEALKEQGVENPTVSSERSDIDVVMKTGSMKRGAMLLTMEIDMGDKIPGYKGIIKVLGTVTEAGPPEFKSVEAPGTDKEFRKAFLSTAKGILEQVEMPEATLKAGESFSQSVPMSIPVGPITMQVDNKITYTLKNIADGKAYFDIVYDFTMSSVTDEDAKAKGTGTGSGTGTFEFDMKESFITEMENDIKMNFDYKMEGVGLVLELGMRQGQSAVITHP